MSELRRGRPLAPLTIVVGSAAVRTHVGDLLVRRLGRVANVNVVTLARLAGDLVTEARGAPPAVLAGLARERFLRRLIAAAEDDLAYFGPVVNGPISPRRWRRRSPTCARRCVEPDASWSEAAASGRRPAVAAGAPETTERARHRDGARAREGRRPRSSVPRLLP